MKDSVTYQAIVEEGMVQPRQEVLLELGRKCFGPPGAAVEMAIRSVIDLDRLKQLIDRLLEVSSWGELLAT